MPVIFASGVLETERMFTEVSPIAWSDLLLGVLLFSAQLRARLRVLINKHFFHFKYEYREEWLRFIETLEIPSQAKDELRALTPATYLGNAAAQAKAV